MPLGARKSVCVFCGSREGNDPAFVAAAGELGHALAEENYRLVYGAGDIGLMGAVARAAIRAGGDTFGVIPEHLLRREVGKRDLGAFVVTETMHERKKVMFMNADAIVTLPGGPGSLDELFEVLTWRQLGLHAKPVYLLNTRGYWTPLITLLMHLVENGFAELSFLEMLDVYATVPELMAALRADL
ncbi:TIGR00730 family Rossman fold protein [Amaricoccus solimangrovi]|uniref:Cytokinin riboside 5'-monophosphate phosphoribohydrolase n=1 Tax=Amaricoccus solimangrovi TaxID=2589815 RepID=A0A501X1D0_9RHOB|nr:TIGR00730 family Rossman fold protein [Amaricoccus solimangrovi]TPE53756.1 TIGR00730 family Rossman fold protein [Amaricoccus solimangrovi]